ncbi:caspase family protein [Streptomyces sp. NPDC001262]|uniref:caspase, EACC1-associated type n=1 Tax=Streptomyces sp. NPDC001262 TaxID=3364552 RepID=UPI0036BDCDD8
MLLIGTGTYASGSGLHPVPAVAASLTDLGQVLVEQCGLAEANLQVLLDPASPLEAGLALAEESERAQEVLLLYYVGHGLVSTGGELYLATGSTDRRANRLPYTALAYAAVRTSLLESPARSTVAILDCCFSGRAAGALAGDSSVAVDLAQVDGTYVLTSAAGEELALAPAGARHTAFTGELIRLLREGDPDGPPELRLSHVYRYLSRVLPARGFPKPRRRASAWIDDLVLAPNPAPRLPEPAPFGDEQPQDIDLCPYPGLAAFEAEQARWFFGRERLISGLLGQLADRLEQATPLIVVGSSGAGKSSLLRAGLLPALAVGTPLGPGSRTWPRLLFTPTADPVGALAAQIARLTREDPESVRAELIADPGEFAVTVRRALRARAYEGAIHGARVVLVVDQFEETFTQCPDEHDRQVFIRALTAATSTAEGAGNAPPALAVLAVRADLYGRCAAYPELLPALQAGQVVLGPMHIPELRAAIERPAAAVGLTVQPALMETLLHDLGAEAPSEGDEQAGSVANYDPGSLPLLSHALRVTWEQREGRTLTLVGYHTAGGLHGAIATTAERAFQRFNATEQQAARQLLLRLVQVGDSPAEARRRADRNTLLAQAPAPDAAEAVLDALARARLVTVDAESVEIIHEALLAVWPRLRGWIDADRAGLHVHQQLTEAAHAWDRDGRPAAGLYRGTTLAVASEWADDPDHQNDLGSTEREFLTASQALHIREEKRRAQRPRQIITTLVILLVLSLAGGGTFLYHQATRVPSWAYTVLDNRTGGVTSLAFANGGRIVAAGSTDGTVHLWDEATHKPVTTLTGPAGSVTSVAFSPHGHILAAGSTDRTVHLWDEATHKPVTTLTGPAGSVTSVAFSPDGRLLAAGSTDRTVHLWDEATHKPVATLTSPTSGGVTSVAFMPDGSQVAAGSTDGTVWNVGLSHDRPDDSSGSFPAGAGVNSVAFSPDSTILASGTTDRTVVSMGEAGSFTGIPGVPGENLDPLTGFTGGVTSVAFSPDGRFLAAGSTDRTVRLWDGTTHKRIAALTGFTSGVTSVAFSPDGRVLAAGSTDRTMRLWDVPSVSK